MFSWASKLVGGELYDQCLDESQLQMTRIRTKSCDRCQVMAAVMYRIQVDRSHPWQFVCGDCWPLLSHNNPDYIYGGTWKARKQ
jgi:hypothetical protein